MTKPGDTYSIVDTLVTPIQARPNDVVEALQRLDHTTPITRAFDALDIPLKAAPTLHRPQPGRQQIELTLDTGTTLSWETRVYLGPTGLVVVETTTRIQARDATAYDRLAAGLGAVDALLPHLTRRMHTTIKNSLDADTSNRQPPQPARSAEALTPAGGFRVGRGSRCRSGQRSRLARRV